MMHRAPPFSRFEKWLLALIVLLIVMVLTVNATKHHHEEGGPTAGSETYSGGGASTGTGSYPSSAVITNSTPPSHLKTPCVQEAEWLDGLRVQCGRRGR